MMNAKPKTEAPVVRASERLKRPVLGTSAGIDCSVSSGVGSIGVGVGGVGSVCPSFSERKTRKFVVDI